jgi:hypothetical protein
MQAPSRADFVRVHQFGSPDCEFFGSNHWALGIAPMEAVAVGARRVSTDACC